MEQNLGVRKDPGSSATLRDVCGGASSTTLPLTKKMPAGEHLPFHLTSHLCQAVFNPPCPSALCQNFQDSRHKRFGYLRHTGRTVFLDTYIFKKPHLGPKETQHSTEETRSLSEKPGSASLLPQELFYDRDAVESAIFTHGCRTTAAFFNGNFFFVTGLAINLN